TLLAAYQSFLTKYTGQNDVIVGSPIANRNHEDIEGLIGFFVNTLSFRLEVKDQMNFNNVLAAIRNKAINAYINQDIPFEKVVDEVQPERNLSYSPIYQTVFIYQNNVLLNDKCEELTLEEWDTTQHMADFDITLRMNEKTYGFEVAFEYNTDLFKEETIRRMTKNFIQWLENIATQPKKKLTQLPLLDDEEKHQLLMDWNQSVTSSHAFPSIPEWFEKQVEASPEAPAVTCAGQTLSYKQLNEKANQLARYLIDHGVQAEDRVGICLGKSTDMIVSMMGILKAGAAYVPIDPEYPAERINYIVNDAGMTQVITEEAYASKLADTSSNSLYIREEAHVLASYETANREETISPDQLAYVIYTSGSTGKPKGVMIEHRGVGNLATQQMEIQSIRPSSHVLQFASFSFDASVFEIFSTFMAGAP